MVYTTLCMPHRCILTLTLNECIRYVFRSCFAPTNLASLLAKCATTTTGYRHHAVPWSTVLYGMTERHLKHATRLNQQTTQGKERSKHEAKDPRLGQEKGIPPACRAVQHKTVRCDRVSHKVRHVVKHENHVTQSTRTSTGKTRARRKTNEPPTRRSRKDHSPPLYLARLALSSCDTDP